MKTEDLPPADEGGFRFHEGGWFDFVCRNEDGSVAWTESVVLNAVTTVGLNDILGVYFNSVSQKTTWSLGLIDNSGFSGVAAGDTAASHAGWSENVTYSNATRPQWTPSAASAGSITGSAAANFTMNGTATIKGAFLISDSAKSGTAGILWATGLFGANQSMSSGQTLSVNYTCPATAT